jgi:hypothetical protein
MRVIAMPYLAMKTKLIQLSAVAAIALTGSIIAADQSPAPSSPPSSSPTDVRNPTNPNSPNSTQGDVTGSTSTSASDNQFQGKITAIDKETKMVTIQDRSGSSKKLHIGDTTKLRKGSTSADDAEWSDLKVGAEIRGTHKLQGSMNHAETVTISSEAK